MNNSTSDQSFEDLLEYLKVNRGFDFTGYKRSSLMRRVNRRMQSAGVASYADYLDYLEVHPDEFKLLFDTILINLTAFFRDAPSWRYLAREIVPQILKQSEHSNGEIRVWNAGCASGEEAYSAAIIFAEAVGTENFTRRVRIYATDLDEDALQKARHASYSQRELEGVPHELQDKYFYLIGDKRVFRSDLRRAIIFGRHDLIQDAPISHLDLLCCRNTLMYFNADIQTHVLTRMRFALKDTGFLFLGKAEMLITQGRHFTTASLDHRIFGKGAPVNAHDRLFTLPDEGMGGLTARRTRQSLLLEAAFELGTVARVVVNDQGQLVQFNQKARAFFSLPPESLGQPFFDSILSSRPVELRPLVQRAYSERRIVSIENVAHHLPSGEIICLDLGITPLRDPSGNTLGVSISFEDMTRYYQAQAELEKSKAELEKAYEELQSTNEELETTNEELQSTIEELETTNEELQSSNEELETTNEELQSANEEMETMNEELQATNEELQTMNEQLRQSSDGLTHVNSYLDSILFSMNMGIVVLDQGLVVGGWNRQAQELWGLETREAEGKSLITLDIGLPVDQVVEAMQACLRAETGSQRALLPAVNRRGQAIQCQVTCLPFVTPEGENRGVILLMEEHRDIQSAE